MLFSGANKAVESTKDKRFKKLRRFKGSLIMRGFGIFLCKNNNSKRIVVLEMNEKQSRHFTERKLIAFYIKTGLCNW